MKNYIIQKGKNKYTPFGGIKLFIDLMDNLNFKNKINSVFSLPKSNRGYTPYAYIKSIISALLLGADCNRSDSAGYQANIINYCNLNNINFFIRAKNIQDYSYLNFKPLKDGYGILLDDMEIAETVHAMDKTEAFRLIVTRKKKRYKDPSLFGEYYYEYYGIATNSNLSKEEVFHFYNKRGQCEYYIKSIKWDLSLRKLPSGSFNGNALWSNIALLSYNVVKLFSVLTGINKSLKSLRYALISAVGSIVNHANRIVLKLHLDDFKFERFLSLRRIIV